MKQEVLDHHAVINLAFNNKHQYRLILCGVYNKTFEFSLAESLTKL
jgi:hypothetical protein